MYTGKHLVKNEKTKFKKNSEFDEENDFREKRKKLNKQIYRNLREEEEEDYGWTLRNS